MSRYVKASLELLAQHRGELFPRVGFIARAQGAVHFYNGRGRAEQGIKQGKYASVRPFAPPTPSALIRSLMA